MDDYNVNSYPSAPQFNSAQEVKPSAIDAPGYHARLKEQYGKVYCLTQQIVEDDDHDRTVTFYFKRPTTGSFDRYAKTIGQSASRASKAFLLDCVIPESVQTLEQELEESPGMAMSIAGKLTDLLGMSNGVNLKLL